MTLEVYHLLFTYIILVNVLNFDRCLLEYFAMLSQFQLHGRMYNAGSVTQVSFKC